MKEKEFEKFKKNMIALQKKLGKCECCDSFHGAQWTLRCNYNKRIKYNVCSNCLNDLVNTRLSTKQYFNLIKNGHSKDEFLLHSDFYDETTGEAFQ